MIDRTGYKIISQYFEWLDDTRINHGFFRGHASVKWQLTPSAFRPDIAGITKKAQLDRWISAASRFVSPRPTEAIDWMILAQHHGIATPLLDWTTNPLIALFFACADLTPLPQSDGVVYVAPKDCFEDSGEPRRNNPFIENRDLPGLVDATAMNPRSMAQDSFMSIHTEKMPSLQPWESGLKRFKVPSFEKDPVLYDLRSLGISEERLFVDLARVVKAQNAALDFEARFTNGQVIHR